MDARGVIMKEHRQEQLKHWLKVLWSTAMEKIILTTQARWVGTQWSVATLKVD